ILQGLSGLLFIYCYLLCSSCERYYTFSGIIKNNSNRTVRIYYYNALSPRQKIDSTVIAKGEEKVIRRQTYLGNQEISDMCASMVFLPLCDTVTVKVDTNRVLFKNIFKNENWSRETDKYDVNCRFTIEQSDI
ncbi:MAG: hypothetical protein RI894_2150, partial [Bacteroidota bacterium]